MVTPTQVLRFRPRLGSVHLTYDLTLSAAELVAPYLRPRPLRAQLELRLVSTSDYIQSLVQSNLDLSCQSLGARQTATYQP